LPKECTKCSGEFTWKQPYDGTKVPCGDNPCTCTPKAVKAKPREPDYSEPIQDDIGDFTILWRKVYQRCSVLAGDVSDERADALAKHITTCGIVHDYFNSRK